MHPERLETDESLRAERSKTDEELARRRKQIEEDADAVVQLARTRADKSLQTARARADSDLKGSGGTEAQRDAVRVANARQDETLEHERAVAAGELEAERERRRDALAQLLSLERQETDEHLLLERDRSDAAVAARDDFLGMVSHDLRTLLGGVALQAAMQIREAGDLEGVPGTLAARAKKIQQYIARMNRLIGDLVDVASIEAGHLAVAPGERDAVPLIRDTVESFQTSAAVCGVTLASQTTGDTMLARYDHERMLQVLANLVSNSLKFTPEGGRILLSARLHGDEVEFSVADTGSGIPAEHLDHIFERFWQAKAGDRRGAGLGLFISRCIVEAHGGRIWAQSEPGKGTTITFTLPGAARS